MPRSTRRQFLSQAAAAALAATLPQTLPDTARAQLSAAAPKKPNVLFIMADDMRVELGCYQSRFGAQTPNLDALAKHGVQFQHNYCQFPLCNPSRASLLTGRHPTTTGVLGNRTDFRSAHPDYVSLPQLFKDNGYVTPRTGKIFHGGLDDPKAWTEGGMIPDPDGGAGGHTLAIARDGSGGVLPPGVLPPLPLDATQAAHSDRIVVLDGDGQGHPDYHTASTAIALLRKYKDQPFFLGCGFVKPHSPPCAPQRFLDLYDPEKIQLPSDFAPWPTVPPGFPRAAIRPRNADLFIGRPATPAEARQVIRAYIASIAWADWNIGRVLTELDRLGLRQNTIVVFIVDHGYQLGEKGKWSKAGSLFEMGTQVPLIIDVPGALGNGTPCPRIVESVNLYPTLAELCNLLLPIGIEGRSMTPLLNNPTLDWPHPARSVWSEDGRTLHGVAIRTETHRYAEFGPDGAHGAMLFDRLADPHELTNLAYDPASAPLIATLSPQLRHYAANLHKTQT